MNKTEKKELVIRLYMALFGFSVENWIEELKERNVRIYKVLRYRFGLEDGKTHTLEETGKLFGVTRERIRQMEAKGLDIIRQEKVKNTIIGFREPAK